MNSAIDGFGLAIRQVDFARPDAPVKVPEFGYGLTPIYRLARRTQKEESHGVEHVGDLPHEEESG